MKEVSFEAESQRITSETAKALTAQPKVKIRVPDMPNIPKDQPQPDETCQVNGHTFLIQRRQNVAVPLEVAYILTDAGLNSMAMTREEVRMQAFEQNHSHAEFAEERAAAKAAQAAAEAAAKKAEK